MQSPVGSHLLLERVDLGEGLEAYQCPESGGLWIPLENYWNWRNSLPQHEREELPDGTDYPVSGSDDGVKLCPESGTIMTKYRVGHGLGFRVDRSNTGGIWLDGGEWEALKAGQIHHTIHLVFTAPWQKTIRVQERTARFEALLEKKLGKDLFLRLTALRTELSTHPARAAALAYLLSTPDRSTPASSRSESLRNPFIS